MLNERQKKKYGYLFPCNACQGLASTTLHHSSLNSMWSLSVYTHTLHGQAYIYTNPLHTFAFIVKKITFQTAIACTPASRYSHTHSSPLVKAWRRWHSCHCHWKGVFRSLSQKVAGGTEGCHLHESASVSCARQRGFRADTWDRLLYDVFDTCRWCFIILSFTYFIKTESSVFIIIIIMSMNRDLL